MDNKGGKKLLKNNKAVAIASLETPKAKKRGRPALKADIKPVVASFAGPEPLIARLKRPSPESLAMLHHLHGMSGRKAKSVRRGFFRLVRLSDALEADWSLWHLAFSVIWRTVLIIALIRLAAAYTVINLLPLL